jgi:hypothetical protein
MELMMRNEKHVLMVTMEPPASHEDEFNDWYDTEHFPQRCALPGFLSGSRWVCLEGWPRWFAYYDVESAAAFVSAAYRAVSGPNSTPWSRRLLARTIGRQRVVARAAPGTSELPLDPVPVVRLLLVRYLAATPARGEQLAAAVAASLRPHRHLIDTRVYLEEQDGAVAVWGVALFRAVVAGPELARLAATVDGVGATVFNLYCPYRRA